MVIPADATLESLTAAGHLPAFVAEMLAGAVGADLRILIAGDSDEGRTALAAALADRIPSGHRVATVEDTATLDLRARRGPRADVVELARTVPGRATRPEPLFALLANIDRMLADWLVVDGLPAEDLFPALLWLDASQHGSITTVATRSRLPLPLRLRVEGDDGRQATQHLLATGLVEVAHLAVDVESTATGWAVSAVWDMTAMRGDESTPTLAWDTGASGWRCELSPALLRCRDAGATAGAGTFGGGWR
jgi:Flp pilus assembly CpaF family ATPase